MYIYISDESIKELYGLSSILLVQSKAYSAVRRTQYRYDTWTGTCLEPVLLVRTNSTEYRPALLLIDL